MSTPENSYSHPENRITFLSSRMPCSFLTFEPCTEGLNLFVSTAGGRRVMLSFGTPILLMYFPRDAEMTMILKESEEHTSELQSHHDLVCRLLLEKKKKKQNNKNNIFKNTIMNALSTLYDHN